MISLLTKNVPRYKAIGYICYECCVVIDMKSVGHQRLCATCSANPQLVLKTVDNY